MTTLRVLLAGGGTAGHVNPLLATAHALRELPGGAEVAALGTEAGLEARLVPAAGLPLHVVPRVPLPRRPSPDLLRLPANLWRAVSAADRALRETRADVVVGFGGYVATPAYLAARRRGVPVVVHEQNALPGIANKVGARLAAAVALTFGSTPLRAARGHTVTTGLPLRAPIAALAARRAAGADERAAARAAAAAELGLDPSPVTVLVTGGSLGAQRLNETLAAASAELLATGAQVLHLTGNGKDAPVRAALASPDGAAAPGAERYHVAEYQDRMELAYAAADLVPGALQYAAPEYLLGQGGSPQSDLFSLAVVTYRMLGGQLPYGLDLARARAPADVRRLRYIPLRHHRPDLPAWLDAVLGKALQADAARRQAVISEFIHDLRAPGQQFRSQRPPPLIERNPVLFWQASTLVLALVALALAFRQA